MNWLRIAESAAWVGGLLLFAWIIHDAWRTGRDYDAGLLLSSREGEIENDMQQIVADVEPNRPVNRPSGAGPS